MTAPTTPGTGFRQEQLKQMQEEIAKVAVSITSPDRNVIVVAGPNSSIKDIVLSPMAMESNPQALSRSIKDTIQLAAAAAARQVAEIVQTYSGAKQDIVARVNKVQEDIIKEEPQDTRGFTQNDPNAANPYASTSYSSTPAHRAPANEESWDDDDDYSGNVRMNDSSW